MKRAQPVELDFRDHCAKAKDRDCGAYKAAFGAKFAGERVAESAQHRSVMTDLKAQLAAKSPGLAYEGYLMALDGSAEKLI